MHDTEKCPLFAGVQALVRTVLRNFQYLFNLTSCNRVAWFKRSRTATTATTTATTATTATTPSPTVVMPLVLAVPLLAFVGGSNVVVSDESMSVSSRLRNTN
jgi:hypothetical protein